MSDKYIVNEEGEVFFAPKYDGPVSPCGPLYTWEECAFDLAEAKLPSPQGQCPDGLCPGFDANGNQIFGDNNLPPGLTGKLGGNGGVSGNVNDPTRPGDIIVTLSGDTIPACCPLGTPICQTTVTGGGNTGPASYHADFASGGSNFSGWLDKGAAYTNSGSGYQNSIFTALASSGKNPAELYPVGKTINLGLKITILKSDGTPTDKTKTVNKTFTVVPSNFCPPPNNKSNSNSSMPSQGSDEPDCGYEVWEWQEIKAKNFTADLSQNEIKYSSEGISEPHFSIKDVTINGEVNINTATGVAVVGKAGQIISITVINRGGGYKTAPTISFDSGGGGTKLTAELTDTCVTCYEAKEDVAKQTYGVKSITIVTPGSGLKGTETVDIGGGAEATLEILGGAASAVTVTKQGDGFKLGKPPLVRIIGGSSKFPISGEGAAATCDITTGSKSVNKVTVTNGGKDYSVISPPKVVFSEAPNVQTVCPSFPGAKGPGKIREVCAPLNPRETLGLRKEGTFVSIEFDQAADTQSKFSASQKKGASGIVTAVGSGVAKINVTDGGSFSYYEGSAIVISGPGDTDPREEMTTKEIESYTFRIHGVVTDVITEEETASSSLSASAAAQPPAPCEVGQWVKIQECGQGCEAQDQNSSTFTGEPARKYVRVGVQYNGVMHFAIIPAPNGWTELTPPTIAPSTLGMPSNAIKFTTGATGSSVVNLSTYFNVGDRNPDQSAPVIFEAVGGIPYPPSCDGPQGAMDTGGVGKPDNGLGASSKRRYPCVKSGAPVGYGEFTPIIKKIPPKEKNETPCKKGDCDKFFSTWMAQAVGPQDENNSFEVNWILLEGCPEPCVNSKPDSNTRIVESTLVDIPCACYEVEDAPNIKISDDSKPKNDYGLFSWKKFFNK